MRVEFSDLPWHDAELLSVCVDRKNPGKNDDITLRVRWPDGCICKLIFKNCYFFEANMNFGNVGEESILKAGICADDEKLKGILSVWRNIGVDLTNLQCFRIETNSTASVLKIYAPEFAIEEERFG